MGCDISYEVDFDVDNKVCWRKGTVHITLKKVSKKDKVGMLFKVIIVSIMYIVKPTNDKDVSGV